MKYTYCLALVDKTLNMYTHQNTKPGFVHFVQL